MRPIILFVLFSFLISVGCFVNNQGSAEILAAEKSENKLPNIVFYLSDDQDIYDYGCYGNDKIQTPAVDRLAKEGMLFKNAFTGQAICAPSRAQLFSGKYPLKNGCFKNHTNSRRDLKTVTKYMRELGYEVVLAGKSHVKPAEVYDWDKVFHSIEKPGTPRKHVPIDSLKNYFANTTQPFCLFITSYYPHGKYFEDDSKKAKDIAFYPFNKQKQENPDFLKKKSGYYRSVQEDNKDLAEVLDLVDQHLDDNTLFLYSADHGVSGKFTVYDRGLNVPFIARWPKVIKAGSQSDVLIHYTDMLPTLMDIAGGRTPNDIDGKSFLSILEGKKEEIHEYVYGVSTSQNIIAAAIFPSRMIRSKKYKYIRNFNSVEVVEQNLGANKYVNAFIRMGAEKFKHLPFEELYDIEQDPFEQQNLAKKEQYQAVKAKLSADMFKWMKAQGDFLPETPGFMPILKADDFQLDIEKRSRKVPDSLKNTLSKADYFYLPFEEVNSPVSDNLGKATKPNILFIAVDDLRPELNAFGASQIKSPNIDKLARQSMIFNRAYCNIPTCGASRASLLTGTRPTRHRFVTYDTKKDVDNPSVVSLIMQFKNHGYKTISNGKVYHYEDDDAAAWNEIWRPKGNEKDYQLETNKELVEEKGFGMAVEAAVVEDDAYFDGKIATKSIADLKELKQNNQAFFLAVGFKKPHLPFNAPQKYWDQYHRKKISLPENYLQPTSIPKRAFHNYGELRQYTGVAKKGHLSDEFAKELIHGYYACVSYVDAQIGRVLDELEHLGLAENTIIVLWGDHGWNLGEHQIWCKHSTFETSLNAPVIVKVPGLTKGTKTDAIIEYVDIYPSLCELAGIDKPTHLEGESFAPVITTGTREKNYAVSKFKNAVTLIEGDLFYTEWTDDAGKVYDSMLFDHSKDPLELDNLVEKEGYEMIVLELSKKLRERWGDDFLK